MAGRSLEKSWSCRFLEPVEIIVFFPAMSAGAKISKSLSSTCSSFYNKRSLMLNSISYWLSHFELFCSRFKSFDILTQFAITGKDLTYLFFHNYCYLEIGEDFIIIRLIYIWILIFYKTKPQAIQLGVLHSVPGGVLLSHGEAPHYHGASAFSLLSSVWGQVGPPLYRRQDYSLITSSISFCSHYL